MPETVICGDSRLAGVKKKTKNKYKGINFMLLQFIIEYFDCVSIFGHSFRQKLVDLFIIFFINFFHNP